MIQLKFGNITRNYGSRWQDIKMGKMGEFSNRKKRQIPNEKNNDGLRFRKPYSL